MAANGVRTRLVLGVVLYSLGVAVLCPAVSAEGIRLALRLQGRASFVLFMAALLGPALRRLTASPLGDWLARERSALFQAFAVSHLIHGIWVLLFFARTDAVFAYNLDDLSGALAFPLTAVLLGLETPPLSRGSGVRLQYLRRGIVVYVWLQFFGFFVERLSQGHPELRPWYVLAIVISLFAGAAALGRVRPRVLGAHAPEP